MPRKTLLSHGSGDRNESDVAHADEKKQQRRDAKQRENDRNATRADEAGTDTNSAKSPSQQI